MLQQLEQQLRKEGEAGDGDGEHGHGRMAEADVVDLTLECDQLHFNVST